MRPSVVGGQVACVLWDLKLVVLLVPGSIDHLLRQYGPCNLRGV